MELDLRLFWCRKYTLLICSLAGIGTGIGYLLTFPATYQTQARVLIQPQEVGPETGDGGRIDPEFLPTQAETIRSPLIIRRALNSAPILPPSGAESEEFDPVLYVLESLKVTPILKANVVTISYRCLNPQEAEKLISNIIDAYQQHVAEHDMLGTKVGVEVVAAREQALRKDLEQAQRDYDALRRTSPLLGQGREANAQALIELNRLGTELAVARSRAVEFNALLEQANATTVLSMGQSATSRRFTDKDYQHVVFKPTQLTTQVMSEEDIERILILAKQEDVGALRDLLDQGRSAKLRLKQLDETYGPLHPGMVSAKSAVAELESRLRQHVLSVVNGWCSQLKVANATASELEVLREAAIKEAKDAESFLVNEEIHKSNLARLEELHSVTKTQLVRMQSTEHTVAGGRLSIEVRVLEGPRVLDDMTWPNPKLLLAVSSFLGLGTGFCIVLLGEMPFKAESESRPNVASSSSSPYVANKSDTQQVATLSVGDQS